MEFITKKCLNILIFNIFPYKTILSTNELFTDIENNNIVLTYKGIIHYKQHPDEIKTEETGEVKWLLASQLITGSFADYNKKMFDFFGIKYD